MSNREEIAKQNGMSLEFVNWFFDNKKDGCGNQWFLMMAAMWEGWKALEAERDALAAQLKDIGSCCSDLVAENVQQVAMLRKLLDARPGGVYFNKFENEVKSVLNDNVATDAFLREQMAKGVENFAGVAETMLVKFANSNCSHAPEAIAWNIVNKNAKRYAAQLRAGEEV